MLDATTEGVAAFHKRLREIRQDYPACETMTYVDVASRGILSRSVRAAIDWYLDDLAVGGDKDAWLLKAEQVRGKLARLLGFSRDEIAFTKNVSEGLNIVARAIDWRPGDNVIVPVEIEHPNNVYTWLNLRRLGVELRSCPTPGGEIDVAALSRLMDSRTRLVTLSAVSFAPGLRADLDVISDLCRERGVLLLVDAAQAAGVLDLAALRGRVDALVASTSKGMLGLYGLGFLACRQEIAKGLLPHYLARAGVDAGSEAEERLGSFNLKLAAGARRFEIGNHNFIAIHALDAALDRLLELDTCRIEPYVLSLARHCAAGLRELGLVVSGSGGQSLSNVVCAGRWQAHHYDADQRELAISRRLTKERVRHSVRRGLLRFSFHFYNTEQDVDRLLAVIAKERA